MKEDLPNSSNMTEDSSVPSSSRCKIYNRTHVLCLPNVFLIGASKAGTTSISRYLDQHPHIFFVGRSVYRSGPTKKIKQHKEVHRFDRRTYGWTLSELFKSLSIPLPNVADNLLGMKFHLFHEMASSPPMPHPQCTLIHYTPHYLYAPTVPQDIKNLMPQPDQLKFIVLLREPVARALSSYWFKKSRLFQAADGGQPYK